MVIQKLLDDKASAISLRIAAIILVTMQRHLLQNLDSGLKDEVTRIISQLEDLPEGLGAVIAWEICGIC